MDDLEHFAPFAEVVRAGSLCGAGHDAPESI